MKLRQLLKAHFDTNGPTNMGRGVIDYNLNPQLLAVYEEELAKCVEFSGSKIVIIPEVKSGKPQRALSGYDEDGVPIYNMTLSALSLDDEPIVTVKLSEKTKFAPTVKIYSISLSPEIFDPQDIFTTKMDTVCITPVMYDLESFTPAKRIVITFSPEKAQDGALKSLRQEIKEQEKDMVKPEYTINAESKNELDQAIKEQETGAKDLMVNVSEDELKTKVQEKQNEYLQTLLGLMSECFNNPEKHNMPCKRTILIRLTADSLVENDRAIIPQADTMVTLN